MLLPQCGNLKHVLNYDKEIDRLLLVMQEYILIE